MTRRRRPPPLGSGVSRPRVHLPGAGLALGAAIGLILEVLAGGGVAIAFGVAGGATLGLLLGGGHSALPVATTK